MRYLLGPWGNDEQGRPIASDTVDWHQDYAPKNGTWEWKSMALGSPTPDRRTAVACDSVVNM